MKFMTRLLAVLALTAVVSKADIVIISGASSAVQTELDPVFTAWDKSTGISINESQVSGLPAPVDISGKLDTTAKAADSVKADYATSSGKLESPDTTRSLTISDSPDNKAVLTYPAVEPEYMMLEFYDYMAASIPTEFDVFDGAKFYLVSTTPNPDYNPGDGWSPEFLNKKYRHPTLGDLNENFDAGGASDLSLDNYTFGDWDIMPAFAMYGMGYISDVMYLGGPSDITVEYRIYGATIIAEQSDLVSMPPGAKLYSDGVDLFFVNKNNVTNNITSNP